MCASKLQEGVQAASKQALTSNYIEPGPHAIPDGGYVVGVDIGGTNLRLALADQNGIVRARSSQSSANTRGVNGILELIAGGVDELLQQISVTRDTLKAVGAGVCGLTDVDAGEVIATAYLKDWRGIPFRALLQAELGVPAVVDNDVNMAAIGEGWRGAAEGKKDFVFLAIGTGIGAGIVVDGRPFRGKKWAAGEVGHMFVPGAPDGPTEYGTPGALEIMTGGEGVKAQWQKVWNAGNTSLPKDLTATQIFDYAVQGDPLAQTILDQSARMLSHAIYNISVVMDPELIVLGGTLGMNTALYDAIQHCLRQRNSGSGLQLTRSILGAEAQVMGAIRSALDIAKSRDEVSPSHVSA